MNIEELKQDILQHTIKPGLIIFENTENSFVANQYIKEIAKQRKLSIEQVESLSEINARANDIFGLDLSDSVLYVCRTKEFDAISYDPSLIERDDVVIVCNKALGGPRWDDRIVKVPKLEAWQIKDYMYSKAQGVNKKQLDWLQDLCENDIYRISEELDKITLFDKKEQDKMFSEFVKDNVFSDLSPYTIFNMSNAIMDKNIKALKEVWTDIDKCDIEPLGLVTILKNNVRNIIKIQLSKCPTAESVGMSPKQFYAVSRSCGKYSKEALIELLTMLTEVDKKLKTGELPADLILDYIVLNMLSK